VGQKLGVSEKVAMEMMIGASMGMNTPKLLEIAGLRGGWSCPPSCATLPTRSRSLEEMAQFASESSFGKKVGTVLDNGWERNYRSTDEGRTAGSEGMRASLDHARQSREAFSASLQETEGHRQMWELSHSGQLGSNLQLQDHFIKDFLLPKLDFNYETFQGIMGDPYKLRPTLPNTPRRTTTGCSARWPVRCRGQMQSARGTRRIEAAFPVPLRSGRRGKATGDR
jgi:hypothetical protein